MYEELMRRLGKSVIVEVIEEGSRLIIRGNAQTYHQKQVAQHVVMKYKTTHEIVNEMTVGRRKGLKTQVAVNEKNCELR